MSNDLAFPLDQGKILVWMPRVSAPFSMLGSLIIINLILGDRERRKEKLKRIPNRFVLIISLIDIPVTIALAMTALAVPRVEDEDLEERNNAYGIRGNTASCNAQAFFVQLGVTLPIYTSMLCMFYLCALRFNMEELTFSRKIEPFAHVFSFIFPLSSAIFGASSGNFNDAGQICWFAPYPSDCVYDNEIECTRGQHYHTYRLIFSIIPTAIAFIIVTVSMLLIFLFVNSYVRRRNGTVAPSEEQRETAIQAALYIFAFLITNLFHVINVLLNPAGGGRKHFSIVVLQFTLYPLQGFWNAVAYTRPIINQLRKYHPHKSLAWSMKIVIFYPHRISHYLNQQRSELRDSIERLESSTTVVEVDMIYLKQGSCSSIVSDMT